MKQKDYKSFRNKYIYGFAVSVVLTLLAYWFVVTDFFGVGTATAIAILLFALLQAVVQAWYFLHLGEEKRPRWKAQSFIFTSIMVMVIVVGSLWVVINMNYNMNMGPSDMREYMIEQNKKGF